MINVKILNTLGLLIIFLGLSMLPSALWPIYYQEYNDMFAILYSSLYSIIFGLLLFLAKFLIKNQSKAD